jgi:hypothetical protein
MWDYEPLIMVATRTQDFLARREPMNLPKQPRFPVTVFPLILAGLSVLALFAAPAARAQTFTVLHTFTGSPGDGANPYQGLAIDGAGNLYGTTRMGGHGSCSEQGNAPGCGTVFKLKKTASGWIYQPLYSFGGPSANDGAYPQYGAIIFGPDGALYGTTSQGGLPVSCQGSIPGCGTVFKLQPPPTRQASALSFWDETVLYRFPNLSAGHFPGGMLAFDPAGNLYGTTENGGVLGEGIVYQLAPSPQGWTLNTIHGFFPQNDGEVPIGGVLIDSSGNLWGTTWAGELDDDGAVFEFTPSLSNNWTENIVHIFGDASGKPLATLIKDDAGNFYGATTEEFFTFPQIFELSPYNGGWIYTVLYTFYGYEDGGPAAPLMVDAAGNLYGTTLGDSVLELSPANGGWTYTNLHTFTGGVDGRDPQSNVVMDSAGNLYGTASYGGSPDYCPDGCGVVWEITP